MGGITATNPHILQRVQEAIPSIDLIQSKETVDFLYHASMTVVRESLRQSVSKFKTKLMFLASNGASGGAGGGAAGGAAGAAAGQGGSSAGGTGRAGHGGGRVSGAGGRNGTAGGAKPSALNGGAKQSQAELAARTLRATAAMRKIVWRKMRKALHGLLANFQSKSFYTSIATGLQFIVPPYDPENWLDIRFVCEEAFRKEDSVDDLLKWKVKMGTRSAVFDACDLDGARAVLCVYQVRFLDARGVVICLHTRAQTQNSCSSCVCRPENAGEINVCEDRHIKVSHLAFPLYQNWGDRVDKRRSEGGRRHVSKGEKMARSHQSGGAHGEAPRVLAGSHRSQLKHHPLSTAEGVHTKHCSAACFCSLKEKEAGSWFLVRINEVQRPDSYLL